MEEGPALLVGLPLFADRDLASQLNSLSKFIFVSMREGPAVLCGISLLTTQNLA